MAIRSMIDDKKKAAFKRAMAEGRPSLVFPKVHDTLVDPPNAHAETPKPEPRKVPLANGPRLKQLNDQLIEGAQKGDLGWVEHALDQGADIDCVNDSNVRDCHMSSIIDQGTPLMWAAYDNRKEVVEMLIARGANLDVTSDYGMTALIWAAKNGNAEIVESLVRAGARSDIASKHGGTALDWAVEKREGDVIAVLEKLKAQGVIK